MKSFEKVRLSPDSTIKEAFEVIDIGAMKIGLVLDSKNKLIGIVTDGDLRRGLLKGLTLEDTIQTIIFRNPTVCNINDSKEAILNIAITKKIYQIPIVNEEGILVGVEELDELLKSKEYLNPVVLMVGGLGTRLKPLTDNVPKPLLEVGNKPILETIISSFAKYGFTNIILSVNYKSQMIEEYFGDGSQLGVNIEYIHEEKRMGTAGALSLIRDRLSKPFFVMNGDLLTSINFEHMLEFHQENQANATMGVREYDFQVPYGVVNLDEQNILSIEEKPVHKFYVSAGVYLLEPSVLSFIPDGTFYDMPSLFDELIAAQKKAVSFPIREYWLDIGRMSDFHKANDDYSVIFDAQ